MGLPQIQNRAVISHRPEMTRKTPIKKHNPVQTQNRKILHRKSLRKELTPKKKTDNREEKKTQPADSGEEDTKKAEEPVEDNIDDAKTGDEAKSDTGNEESAENAESGLED